MPHIPGHPAEEDTNQGTGGMSFLFPDTVEEDTGVESPEEIAGTDDDFTGLGGAGNELQFAQEIADILTGEISDPNKPLGQNFQKVYQVKQYDDEGNVIVDPDSNQPKVTEVSAEVFLTSDDYQEERRELFGTGEAFKYIYYGKDITSQFNRLQPYLRVQAKNLLANAGLINLEKTYGSYADAETLKGIKLAMDFSMNNNGKQSWFNVAKALSGYAQSQRAYKTGTYQFTEEDLTDFADEFIGAAEARKGSPLTKVEKDIILKKLGGAAEEFEATLPDLDPGQPESLQYNPLTGETQFIPAVEPEEPDVEMLSEEGEKVLDEIFAPREALAEEADIEDDTFARMQRNLRGLSAQETQRAKRG